MKNATIWLAAAHLAGNAAVLFAFYLWLGTGESDTPHLAASAALILICLAFAVWLHGSALAYFAQASGKRFSTAFAEAGKHLLPLVVLTLIAGVAYWLLTLGDGHFHHAAYTIGSYFTLTFRKPVSPERVTAVFHGLLLILRWVVFPALLWPVAARIAISGWTGFRVAARSRSPWYWLQVCALLLCAVWVPMRLLDWIPAMPNFWAEMASFVLRFGVAYLLLCASLLCIAWRTVPGMPVLSQRNSASTP